MSDRPVLSIVSPVFNEASGIAAFYAELTHVLDAMPGYDREVILVDDGSSDTSFQVMSPWLATDPTLRLIRLSRNFGHQVAITAGIDAATGDAVVVIDSDLQDPPAVIVDLVQAWEQGADVAYAVRRQRPGESAFKRTTAHAFYRSMQRFSDVDIPIDTGDFRLMSRRVVEALKTLREESRYVRGLVSWVGFPQVAVEYDRAPRHSGESHYTLSRMLTLAVDGLTGFSVKPLRFVTTVGLIVSVISLLVALFIIVSKVLQPENSLPGFATLAVIVLFIGGVQLIALGIVGEYVGRVFREAQDRPLYIVRDDLGSREPRRPAP